jgi:hypothetical protein
MTADGERYCGLGERSDDVPEGDKRLAIEVTARPDDGPWTVRATSRSGESFDVTAVSFFGTQMTPIWLSTTYKTLRVEPEREGMTCDQLFGLEAL